MTDMHPLDAVARIRRRLWKLYTRSEAEAWMRSPHQLLGRDEPYDVILRGDANRVDSILDQLESGAYT